ncbi:unnamed protein product (macronuclear) [Paramecium tetraurelia]|uniref:Uncharacterized protein n=1 Tax=Paramecium tetraurelia TaxID=5888 RepID=A0E4F9_PARTE|nr:uncharacterized protein GSPATT00023350001 [Paramecium tetraurelia]CAK90176.1 unnamed protein product [Paramecium tetraurelia]|eukprot:XP_001457573.1 hypothetical protein (macronuclear) [Paramecium tetraurelia strain d4-2]
MSYDPQYDLLNLEHTKRDSQQMPLKNQFFQKLETEFIAEPWDVPIIVPVKKKNQNTRLIYSKQSKSHMQPRQLSNETPHTPQRPKSCQQKNQFIDLGIPAATPTYAKIIQRMIITAPRKSSKKNSNNQNRQKCIQSMLVAQQQNSQLQNLALSSNDKSNYISQINPVIQKIIPTQEPQFNKCKFKLKKLLN